MIDKSIPFLFALISIFFAGAASAEVWSWRDKDGRIHYGDRAPPERKQDSRVLQGLAETPDVKKTIQEQKEKKLEAAINQGAAGAPAPESPQEKLKREQQRRKECVKARATLGKLESGQARFMTREDGGRVALDGEVRAQSLARARKLADQWCSPPEP